MLSERFSGSSRSQLTRALNILQLIEYDGTPAEKLRVLVASIYDQDRRSRILKAILKPAYPRVFDLDLERATFSQFHDAFKSYGLKDTVTTKAETFFIHSAKDANITLSEFITPRSRKRSSRLETSTKGNDTSFPLKETDKKYSTARLILGKYPDFDPAWPTDIQASWLNGIDKLRELLLR